MSVQTITQTNWNPTNKTVIFARNLENPSLVTGMKNSIVLSNCGEPHDGVLCVDGLGISHCNPKYIVTDSELSDSELKEAKHIGCIVMSSNSFIDLYKPDNIEKLTSLNKDTSKSIIEDALSYPQLNEDLLLDDEDLEEPDDEITQPIPKGFFKSMVSRFSKS